MPPVMAFDLAARGGDLHDADRERNRRVLEDAEEFRRQGRDDDAKSKRQEDVTIGLRKAETRGPAGRGQADGDAGDPRANLLGDARGGVEAKTYDCRKEFRMRQVALQPMSHLLRHHLGQHEEPQEHLDEDGDVAKQVDIGGGQSTQKRVGQGASDPDQGAEREGDHPGRQGKHHGGRKAIQQPAEIRLADENRPVPVIGRHQRGTTRRPTPGRINPAWNSA